MSTVTYPALFRAINKWLERAEKYRTGLVVYGPVRQSRDSQLQRVFCIYIEKIEFKSGEDRIINNSINVYADGSVDDVNNLFPDLNGLAL